MALETGIIEIPFAQGQNEGVDRSVLPVGQLYSARNVRYRKGMRLGKRHGYSVKTSVDASAVALGNGGGRLSCLGPQFCAVDSKFYMRDTVADAWALPPVELTAGFRRGGRITGDFPDMMPGSAFAPIDYQNDLDLGGILGTTTTPIGAMTKAQGYLFTAAAFYNAAVGAWVCRVVGTDPATRQRIFRRDYDATAGGTVATQQHPILLSTGNGTVVLIYDHFTAGTKDGIRFRLMTDIDAGFGAEFSLACVESGCNYCTGSADEILIAYSTGAANITTARWSVTTQAVSTTVTNVATSAPTLISVFGSLTGPTWTGYTDSGGLKVRAYTSGLVANGISNAYGTYFAVGTTPTGPILFASRSATVVTTVGTATGGMFALDMSASAARSPAASDADNMLQGNCTPLSWPFSAGGSVYIWVRYTAEQQAGVATLVRVPLASEYTANFFSPFLRSFPIEGSVEDMDVDDPVAAVSSGPTFPPPVQLDGLGYVALLAETAASLEAATDYLLRRFVVTPVRHRSEGLRYSASCVVPVLGKYFVAGACPMWVDIDGAKEAGFVQAPVAAAAAIITAGGSLETNSTYFYTAIFESIDALGRIERSAPTTPIQADTTANTTATVEFTTLELSRKMVRAKLYRTLADQPVYHLVGHIEASPTLASAGNQGERTWTFVDTYADLLVGANEPLYTQIGSDLATAPFPACTFANTGGGRLWCAGGFRGNVATASKLFTPRISPEFTDDDAFRVTLPQEITGMAWCDSQVIFTRDGIWYVAGDGPDNAGVGFFSLIPLPFPVGCIDWRSVVATKRGIYFQSDRGMMLLPRGFSEPIPVDAVQDTLETYPIVTAARAFPADDEDTVQWCLTADEAATTGVIAVFDQAFDAVYVDTFSADYPATFLTAWDGERVMAPQTMTVGPNGAGSWHPFRVDGSGYADGALPIPMAVETGDVRPWGLFAHGVINRIGLFGAVKTAATLGITTTTEHGTRTATKAYTVAGEIALDVALGKDTLRDANFLRVAISETSAVEGVTLTGLVIEHDKKNQGFRLLQAADRIT